MIVDAGRNSSSLFVMFGTILRAVSRGLDTLASRRWYRMPLGSVVRPSYLYDELAGRAQAAQYSEVDEFEKVSSFAVDPVWFHGLGAVTQVSVKRSEPCYAHGRVLYSAVRRYIAHTDTEQLRIVETGTAKGFSSLCMARALEDGNAEGLIVTLDLLPHDHPMLWNSRADSQGPRSRAELLSDYRALCDRYIVFQQGDSRMQLRRLQLPRIHVAFFDGAHGYKDVVAEGELVAARQRRGDLLIFDDYARPFPRIVAAVDTVCARHGYSKEIVCVTTDRAYVVATREN